MCYLGDRLRISVKVNFNGIIIVIKLYIFEGELNIVGSMFEDINLYFFKYNYGFFEKWF